MNLLPTVRFTGDPANNIAAEAQAVDTALRTSGFMLLDTPALTRAQLAPAFAAAARFFAAPVDFKQRFAYRDTSENFGWQDSGTEALDPSAPPDLKESFTMRDLQRRADDLELFPDESFRTAALDLHRRCTDLAHALMHHLATALEVEREFFPRLHSGANVTLRLLHYPGRAGAGAPTEGAAIARQLGAGAHTDYGSFTLLLQDGVPGLQLHDGQGWFDAPGAADRVVFNVGDLMSHWSNDRWPSTWHRVKAATGERYSIAFFVDPDDDAEVDCLPSCTRDRPAAYAATTAGEHILRKLDASRSQVSTPSD